MPEYTQDNRPMRVSSPLGKDVLLLEGLDGRESVSSPFLFRLRLLSEKPDIDPKSLLRQNMVVTMTLDDGSERYINGVVRRFTQHGMKEGLATYEAEIVPWLWFLALTQDCKIYQNLSVPDIVEKVFKAQGFSDFTVACTGSYSTREYCVQYRESHLDFVSRLLEEEGIFYYFKHTEDKHTLVLADANGSIGPCPGQGSVPISQQELVDKDVITALQAEQAVYIGQVSLKAYDHLQPSLTLASSLQGAGKGEVYDYYPGKYTKKEDGDRYARLRLEAQEAKQQTVRGSGNSRNLHSGHKFTLEQHYRDDVNTAYVLLEVEHSAEAAGYRAGEEDTFRYENHFTAVPHSVPYRPEQRTSKPVVHGSQTAVVVGKSGEELWTDKHGRVKVQFHWDRDGKKDENSSCWVRVASPWAGKSWGAIQLPRIGQEVIVDFLEGDPDHPIITGRVYNAEQTPPYDLPANQTVSGLKSRSSKGGGTENFNEIRMQDEKGKELFVIHAEKDQQVEVENDCTVTVGHDQKITIENDRTEEVKGNEKITITKDRTEEVKGNEKITITKDRTEEVKGNDSLKVMKGLTITVMEDITIKSDTGQIAGSALKQIELKVGANSIVINQQGVTIKGIKVSVEGTAQAEMKSVMTSVKGDAMLKAEGPMTQVNGSGLLKMQGGITMIN
jgi:type VI secretion system secreted protein VgrG